MPLELTLIEPLHWHNVEVDSEGILITSGINLMNLGWFIGFTENSSGMSTNQLFTNHKLACFMNFVL